MSTQDLVAAGCSGDFDRRALAGTLASGQMDGIFEPEGVR
jgi:hypothetical protein